MGWLDYHRAGALPSPPKRSRLGVASLVVGAAAGIVFVAACGAAAELRRAPSTYLRHPVFDLLSAVVCGGAAAGGALGIAGLVQRNRRRGLPFAGLLLNAALLAGVAVVHEWARVPGP